MAEKEYIEKRALKPLFDERFHTAFIQEKTRENPEYWRGVCAGVNWGLNTLYDAPAADVVEVVRCKDCVYWDGRGWDGRCEPPSNGLIREYTNYDDFCSYGKRKEAQG